MSGTFLAGALSVILLMGLFSFSSPSAPALTTLTPQQANTYFNNYMKTATATTGPIKGVTLDKVDFTAMSNLLTAFPNLAGFRIYNGLDNNNAKIEIIVAIDNTAPYGADLTTTIYNAPVTNAGLCPPVCDVNSPIIKQ